MPATPLVSIIVPCYGHERFVRDTIESVWAQSYPHVELIVIDDASPDGSANIIADARRSRDFVFLRNDQNRGLNATIERGLSVATGELVGLLASDDVILPEKVALQVEWMERHGLDGVLSTGFALYADGRREPIVLDRVARRFADGTILRHVQTDDTEGALLQSGLFRAGVLRELAPLRRQFRSDDWAMSIRMLEQFRIGFLNRPLFLYRQHDSNSHRDYWRTFPMRVEVVSLLTPPPLRFEALANLFASQASYLAQDGHRALALRCLGAALLLDPSPARVWRPLRNAVSTRLGRLRAALRGALIGQR
jgi:glycosyltransferase involved in cell wall biosynthesis